MRSFRATVVAAAWIAIGAAAGCASDPARQTSADTARLFQEAKGLYEKDKFFKARTLLTTVVNHPSAGPDLLAETQLLLADAFYYDKSFLNLTEAQGRYQSFISFHPRHDKVDYAQYQLAMCYYLQVLEPDRDQAQTRRAIDEFGKIETLYPGSRYLPLARDRIGEGYIRMAEHEYSVGRYYLRRKAPRAARQRFQNLLLQYPEFPVRDGVYFYLSVALRRDGDADGAREYLQRLLAEFPDGPYAGRGRQSLEKLGGLPMAAEEGRGDDS